MTWWKLDDAAAFHPKIMAAGNPAVGLWVRAGAWCAGHLTDGLLPWHMVAQLDGRARDARHLVAVGLWTPVGPGTHGGHGPPEHPDPDHADTTAAPQRSHGGATAEPQRRHAQARQWPWRGVGAGALTVPGCELCASASGLQFHDWTDWQPTKQQVRQARSANAARQARWRERRTRSPDEDPDEEGPRRTPAKRNGVSNSAPTRPDPTSNKGNSLGGVLPTATRVSATPPPRRCQRHRQAPTPGPCRACADARADHEDWARTQAQVPRIAAPRCPLHPDQLARDCPACADEATPAPADLRAHLRKRA